MYKRKIKQFLPRPLVVQHVIFDKQQNMNN